MKAKLKVLVTLIVAGIFISQCCKNPASTLEKNEGYEEYAVTIINESNVEVTDFYLEMIGSDDCFKINRISKGAGSYSETFTLPVLKEVEGEKPISWGDYAGYYTQNGLKRDIFIFNYKHNFCKVTTIKMDAEFYKVSFSDL